MAAAVFSAYQASQANINAARANAIAEESLAINRASNAPNISLMYPQSRYRVRVYGCRTAESPVSDYFARLSFQHNILISNTGGRSVALISVTLSGPGSSARTEIDWKVRTYDDAMSDVQTRKSIPLPFTIPANTTQQLGFIATNEEKHPGASYVKQAYNRLAAALLVAETRPTLKWTLYFGDRSSQSTDVPIDSTISDIGFDEQCREQ